MIFRISLLVLFLGLFCAPRLRAEIEEERLPVPFGHAASIPATLNIERPNGPLPVHGRIDRFVFSRITWGTILFRRL